MRDRDMDRRLLNWSRWVLSGNCGSMGHAAVNWSKLGDSDGGRDGYVTASVPILGIEASETQDAVMRLEPMLRETVQVEYLANLPLADKLRCLGVTRAAVALRLERADRALAMDLTERAAGRRDAAARVRAVTSAARP
jgi:hypothetical protein